MEKPQLLDDSSSSSSDNELKINQEYAQTYDKWKQKEEYQKLKEKYGDVSKTSSSSSDSEDDESPVVDKSFYKALSLVKSHDSKIYDTNDTLLSDSEVQTEKKPKVKKSKPVFLKDYERNIVLQTGGNLSDCEDKEPPKRLRFDEEQEQIKKSFASFDLGEDDDDSSDILNVRSTTKAEQEKLQEDYIEYLKGHKEVANEDQDEKKDLTFLHDFWNDPNLNEKERFLRDYFLNARYEEEDKTEKVPTYEEITEGVGEESDEEVAAEFEQKYNFRFEEPDAEFIKRYPRTMKDTLRKKNQKRKMKREEHAERKRLEKEQRREEIKRLKALKRKEIEEKLSLLKETLDDENIALENVDIDGDFDPAEHDKKMSELFNDQYYDVPEKEKPTFPEDEELDFENWDSWTGVDDTKHADNTEYDDPHCEDPDFNMDAECEDPKAIFQKEMLGASKQRSKRKKKSCFASAVGKKKPLFEPSDKSFEQYFKEYYSLDCEDFIGDLRTRFKYREVVPNDYGLSVGEVLKADDKELNKWCSLKKICQIREANEELYDVQAYQKKAQNEHKKKKIFSSLYHESSDEDVSRSEQQTEKKKKKQKKAKTHITETPENGVSEVKETSKSTVQFEAAEQISSIDKGRKNKKQKKSRDFPLNQDATDMPLCVPENSETTVQNGDVNLSFSNSEEKHMEETSGNAGENHSVSQKERKRKRNRVKSRKFSEHNPGDTGKFSKSPHQKKQSKHKPTEVTDKRLLLSDKRLEAYGINAKKFKNKIIYSNK